MYENVNKQKSYNMRYLAQKNRKIITLNAFIDIRNNILFFLPSELYSYKIYYDPDVHTVTTILKEIISNVEKLNGVVIPLDIFFDQFTNRVEYDQLLLKAMFSSIDYTATNLSLSFKKHKKQTADKLAHLHASFTSTRLSLASHISKINSKLEALNTYSGA